MRIGRIEFGTDPLGVALMPNTFSHKNVAFDDELFADEYGIFWLGFRVSLYIGSKTWSQVKAARRR